MVKKKLLEGVNVVQFCWVGVGVFTINFLNHYRATTILVETSAYPDPVRVFEPFAPNNKPGELVGLERSAFYQLPIMLPGIGYC